MLTALTPRKRFNRAMRFQSVDRIPLLHMGVWRETAERWQKEGMLSETQEFAAFDGPMQSCWLYGKFQGLLPAFGEIKLACESGSLECDTHSEVYAYSYSVGLIDEKIRWVRQMLKTVNQWEQRGVDEDMLKEILTDEWHRPDKWGD
ncbi:MAG: hypothetical protein KKG09_05905 [Verrucomicrobia bacterium]|nr:hypothetical protein [Verrucomicrobiota bacterium]MCG2681063.1 hypothetical protein [Kiritimatiellia bacterium]MBU4248047.1 hypothetical protein [Verrucomicrobiota bacterium]MBU4291987.1 hypothetical protein [Verrucomicrobiota bacterium]MBU4430386.1 hypothetical protein [Verrucomicrobiota bacterium]